MKLASLATAALLGLASPALAVDLSAMSAEEKAAFGDAVRAYLLENPEVLTEAIEVLKDRQAAAEAVAESSLRIGSSLTM